jgi:hypothetical protein
MTAVIGVLDRGAVNCRPVDGMPGMRVAVG